MEQNFDDDGRDKRTGTLVTASAHIITAVIGSGVLSLAWAVAQLGWVVGPVVLMLFSFITYFNAALLADCYRSPDPVTGKRNYTYTDVDTLKSSPPENKVMKKASLIGVSTTTFFYMLCGCLGYAAFGNNAPGNFLTGFGFYEPFWLVDIANLCIVIHLIGAYQVFGQPFFHAVEDKCQRRWPDNDFVTKEYLIRIPMVGECNFNIFRLVWRSTYVVVTTLVAIIFPFFNDFLGLLGSLSFWPLTVYFPTEMYLKQAKIQTFSFRWTWMKILSYTCLVVSLVAATGSIRGLIKAVGDYKPFQPQS